jgi:hypothetical protein
VVSYRELAVIDAPLDRVWELVGDPRRYPSWCPGVREVHAGEPSAGSSFQQVTRMLSIRVEREWVVEQLDDGREMLVRCTDDGCWARWALAPAQGGTFLEFEAGMDPTTLPSRVFARTLGKAYYRRWLGRAIQALREEAESSPAPARTSPAS